MSGVRIPLPRPVLLRIAVFIPVECCSTIVHFVRWSREAPHQGQRGLGVGFVIADVMRNGIQVALPISEHLPFDCIGISSSGELSRISVKYRSAKQGRIEVRFRSSRADRNGSHTKQHGKNLYDATAIYCPEKNVCYYVKNDEVDANTIVLRVDPAKNNQARRVKAAEKYSDPERLFLSR